MTEIVFDTGSTDHGFYTARVGDVYSKRLYFLLRKVREPLPASLSLSTTWNQNDSAGWYIFVGAPVENMAEFADQVRNYLDPKSLPDRGCLWIPAPGSETLEATDLAFRPHHLSGAAEFIFHNLKLQIPERLDVTLENADDDKATFHLTTKEEDAGQLFMYANGARHGSQTRPLSFGVWGEEKAGALHYGYSFDGPDLLAFGGDIRYFQQVPGIVQPRTFRFPVIDLNPPNKIDFDVWLDPFAIEDFTKTALLITPVNQGKSYPSFLTTVNGGKVFLAPDQGAGLAFASAAKVSGKTKEMYLTPGGPFTVELDSQTATLHGREAKEGRLLCGLFGAEFVALGTGSQIVFRPGKPAYAPFIEPRRQRIGANGESERLIIDGTTSWVSFAPPLSNPQSIIRYFAQPELSPYYGSALSSQDYSASPNADFAAALDVNVSRLVAPDGQPATIPFAPYAGVAQRTDHGSINPDMGPADFTWLENEVLSPERQRLIPPNENGPVFSGSPTTGGDFCWTAKGEGTNYGVTSQGLVAALNTEPGLEGTWRELILAVSDDREGNPQHLSFLPSAQSKTIAGPLADALMGNDFFLVLSLRKDIEGISNVGEFQSKVTVEGFTFDLSLADSDDQIKTIVIIKFKSRALKDLVADISAWTRPELFNHSDGGMYPVQKKLEEFLNVPEDPRYANFRTVISDPNWNGILAFNCDLHGNALPLELLGLRGGMPGGIVGHHLGIEINKIQTGDSVQIEKSSIFGFIATAERGDTPGDTDVAPMSTLQKARDFDFTVDPFYVSFLNSVVVDFVCDITLTVNLLFGRPVKTGDPSEPLNKFKIRGGYQEHENEKLFVFETDGGKSLEIDQPEETLRVLTNVSIHRVKFTTDSTEIDESRAGTFVEASFQLEGGISFADSGTLPIDIFGHGENEELPYRNLKLAVSFLTEGNGAIIDKELFFNPAEMTFDAKDLSPRSGSLLGAFPLTLSGFSFDPNGLSASGMGGQTVYSSKLQEYTTPSPVYALTFTLPLGSLGALSSVQISLDALFTVGWGPNPTIPEDDAVALAIKLPQITPGVMGFSLQGILNTTFGTCNLINIESEKLQRDILVLTFNNVGLSLLSFKFPPGYIIDFLITSIPNQTSEAGNVAWLLALKREDKEQMLRELQEPDDADEQAISQRGENG